MEQYALITGATSGLGLAYAKWFAGKGYDLIMTGRRKEVIERRAQEIRDKSCLHHWRAGRFMCW